ncbi:MAG TPA: hypothetical protein VFW39_03205 [Sphingomicrobium sp.]|nr:hypothetical protein [Sphingomicrobium sp.]
MLNLLVLAAAAATPPSAVPAIVGGLEGCWNAPGQVMGKDATSVARGDWQIGHLYFVLHLRSTGAAQPYEAAIIYGAERAGAPPELQQAGSIGSYWLDTFGGAGPVKTIGSASANGFTVAYDYGDSVYTNRFTRVGKGWQWTILAHDRGKPEKLFAEYHLTPATCSGMKFGL